VPSPCRARRMRARTMLHIAGFADVVSFVRVAVLAACIAEVCVCCAGAAVRRAEGAAGAAVRIVLTLVAPATALAFAAVFVWPLALGGSVVAAFVQGRGTAGALRERIGAIWRSLSLPTKAAAGALLVVAAFRCGAAIASPHLDGDSLMYHLPVTAALLQDRGMWFTRAVMFPSASEIADAVACATAGTLNARAIIGLLTIGVMLSAAYAWARRAGARQDGAAAAAIIAGAMPISVDQMFTSLNDLLVCGLLACTCALWRRSPRLAALAAGLVVATKVTALWLVPAVGVVMIAFEGWPFSFADVAWALVVAAPWYLRTVLLAGHVVAPMASMGWASTIAKNFSHAWRMSLDAIRHYGGQTAIGGAIALPFIAIRHRQISFARALPWLALAAYVAWILMPNAAESVPGTLDQIREGWSIRYALLLLFILATALPIALDDVRAFPLPGLLAVAAAASAIVRSGKATATFDASSFPFALGVGIVVLCVMTAALWKSQPLRRFLVAAAIVVWAVASVRGAQAIREHWNSEYIQWTNLLPPSTIASDRRIAGYHNAAVIGLRPFPLVGPDFTRHVYEDFLFPPDVWLRRLRSRSVGVLVAAGRSGSPDEPGFLQPTPVEVAVSRLPGVCLIGEDGYVRLYALDATASDPRCQH